MKFKNVVVTMIDESGNEVSKTYDRAIIISFGDKSNNLQGYSSLNELYLANGYVQNEIRKREKEQDEGG